MSPPLALQAFDAMLASRQLDFVAMKLRSQGRGFYTIGSAGHEGNVAVAAALRTDDPAFLHYRSGGFFLERAARAGYEHGVRDVLLGMVAARDEPIAGGRHKVFGSRRLWIPPQTSTIASQLPKAVGMAFALRRATRLGLLDDVSRDAIVTVSFGDASANHSTATGAINAASYIAHQDLAVPVLFVCEDNGLGISVETPVGWIENQYGTRGGLQYYAADGCDVVDAYTVTKRAAAWVRRERKPAFLRLATVRLLGHAGSDVALAYRSADKLRSDMARDPLLAMARTLIAAGVLTPDAVLQRYREAAATVERLAEEAATREGLSTAAEVVAPLSPRRPPVVAEEAQRKLDGAARREFWGRKLPEDEGPATLSVAINRCLGDLLVQYPELMVFGEDVAKKGGVYGVTRGLHKRAGVARVFDTLLDEQTILGQAIGAAQAGFIAVPEIQYLAYLHNAEDQLRGEAASLQFFSRDQFRNPMVVLIASYAYQKGFGGHFHNDNSVAVLRDIPGLVIASPSNGQDAAAMLRTCVAAAKVDGTV
ncbi:MAG: thiamine pyrophosphate-dependent enzyme, partial [Myxococcota bacterium]